MGKKGRGRDVGKERFWRKLLRGREQSGLTVRAFCRQEGLTESAYYFWRSELRRRDGHGSSPATLAQKHRDALPQVQRRSTFAAVTVADAAGAAETMPIEIVLRDGVRVRVGPVFDARALREILGVLEAGPC